MNIKGTRITKEDVTIEVTQRDILEAFLKIFCEKYDVIYGDSFIDSEGYIHECYGYHPHNGDAMHNITIKATEYQQKYTKQYIELSQLCRELKLK